MRRSQLLLTALLLRCVQTARPQARSAATPPDQHGGRANAIDVEAVVTVEVPVRCAASVYLTAGPEVLAEGVVGSYTQVNASLLPFEAQHANRPVYQSKAGHYLVFSLKDHKWTFGKVATDGVGLLVEVRSIQASSQCPSMCPTDACGWESRSGEEPPQWLLKPEMTVEAQATSSDSTTHVEQEEVRVTAHMVGNQDDGDKEGPAVAPLPPGGNTPLYAYIILGEGGTTLARAIIDGRGECPSVTSGTETVEAHLRFAGDARFPVRVCEAELPSDFSAGKFGTAPLPNLSRTVHHTLVLGDTGVDLGPHCQCLVSGSLHGVPQCKLEENITCGELGFSSHFRRHQGALSSFTSVAVVAAENDPELVIHTGGFVHRHTPCGHKLEGCPRAFGSSAADWGDRWLPWLEDFFMPGKPLLEAAPWIVVRGEQEGCLGHWRGWAIFLDPRPSTPEKQVTLLSCPDAAPAYRVHLARERFIVMDDSFVPSEGYQYAPGVGGNCSAEGVEAVVMDRRVDPDEQMSVVDEQVDFLAEQLRLVKSLTKEGGGQPNILLSHRPIFAVTCRNGDLVQHDWTMQQAFEKVPDALSDVMLVIGGHLRFFELLQFEEAEEKRLPAQMVVGNTNPRVAKVGVPYGEIGGASKTKVLGHNVLRGTAVNHYGFATLSSSGESINVRAMMIPQSEVPKAFFRATLRRQ
mmetsp:Transcript_47189/g.109952  ORF Transcript_47189/g.109952 Transcript_47189/m.109952 type:complete len:690 (-) Transcript_47189:31-2100(-)